LKKFNLQPPPCNPVCIASISTSIGQDVSQTVGMAALNLPSYKERAAILGIGLLGNFLIANGFDYVLYPWVIWKLGPLHGAAVMTLASFLICWATLLFYDWAKKDWLGIETLKELRDNAGNSRNDARAPMGGGQGRGRAVGRPLDLDRSLRCRRLLSPWGAPI
jgi:hypothetical protein